LAARKIRRAHWVGEEIGYFFDARIGAIGGGLRFGAHRR